MDEVIQSERKEIQRKICPLFWQRVDSCSQTFDLTIKTKTLKMDGGRDIDLLVVCPFLARGKIYCFDK